MGPLARQARQQIFELRKFDLQLTLVAARALGENIQDQLAAIDDAHFERRFQIALLRRRQVFVDDDEVGVAFLQGLLNFVDLAAANQSRRRDVFHLLAVLFEHGGRRGFAKRRAPQVRSSGVAWSPTAASRIRARHVLRLSRE